jgi:hypothetical protein
MFSVAVGCGADPVADSGRGSTRGSGTGGSKSTAPTDKPDDFGTGNPTQPTGHKPTAPTKPVLSSTCGRDCVQVDVGPAGMLPFDLKDNPNEGVGLDPDGALIVAQGAPADRQSFIWIADTGSTPPTVSKVDTRTKLEVARYAVGAPDPSRTSVSMNGDAYVGSRNGAGVTKISGAGKDCPDTNGDGMVTTSTGPADVLPFGQDDCMLWFVKFTLPVRGVAAQDIPGQTMIEPQLEAPPVVTTTPDQHFVWIGEATPGNNGTAMAHKLDGDTGAILLSTPMPRGAYGFALDGNGMLWLTGGAYWSGSLAFIDTKQCVDAASCNVAPCVATCSPTACPATCDGAVKGDITLAPSSAYGITVDCKQRVWLGGYGGSIARYDHSAMANQRLTIAPAGTNGVHGIAADADGWVWGAARGRGVVRLDADTMTQTAVIPTARDAKGMAIDADGQVWVITQGSTAHVITPGMTVADNTVAVDAVQGLVSPYTYSDMTGQQLVLASGGAPGTYQQVFEGCEGAKATTWKEFIWDAETPDKTWLVFEVRTADTLDDLEKAKWLPLAGTPSAVVSNSASIELELMRTGEVPGKYLELRVALNKAAGSAGKCGEVDPATPRVKALSVTHSCPPDDPG